MNSELKLQLRAIQALRRHLPAHLWHQMGNLIADDRAKQEAHLRKPDSEIDKTLFGKLDAFNASGFMQLPLSLEPDLVDSIRNHLELNPVFDGSHIFSSNSIIPTPLSKARTEFSMAGYHMDQIIRTPGVVDIFNHPAIIDFLELYFGCVPTLYSLASWWAFPGDKPEKLNVQHFHRDVDDWKFCTVFLYLTDVDEDSGPHQVIPGSHRKEMMELLLKRAASRGANISNFDIEKSFVSYFGEEFSRQCEELFGDDIKSVTGPRGTLSLVNTVNIHRGLLPKKSERLLIWARYGLGPNINSSNLEQGPIGRDIVPANLTDSPRNRYVNRLLMKFDHRLYLD